MLNLMLDVRAKPVIPLFFKVCSSALRFSRRICLNIYPPVLAIRQDYEFRSDLWPV